MAKRAKVTVRWDRASVAWRVDCFTGLTTAHWGTKADAVADGRIIAKNIAAKPGSASELWIYGKNGRLQDRRSYGTDPRSTRG